MTCRTRRSTRLFSSAVVASLLGAATAQAGEQHLVSAYAGDAESLSSRVFEDRLSPGGWDAPTPSPTISPRLTLDLGALREAIDHYRRGNIAEGDRARAGVDDPAAKALTEWLALRSGAAMTFERIVAFMRDHPEWSGSTFVRRRAEEALLANRRPAATVRAYFAAQRPFTASGKFALALAFAEEGADRDAAALVRDAWRNDTFGREFEARILEAFPEAIAREDHRFRMERLLFKQSWEAAQRAAKHAGADYLHLVKARRAVEERSKKAAAALDAVPAALRTDTSYIFARAQHLRRTNKPAEAAKALAGLTRDPEILVDGDEWWIERRVIARELLDVGEPRTAYEVASRHGAESVAQRIEAEFHAGWIALRFLAEPAVAALHFATAAGLAETPISLSRTAYWQGRAAEALDLPDEARRHYERAAQHSITYYGQLARGKLGQTSLPLRATETDRDDLKRSTPAQALRLLYEAGASELAIPLFADLAQRLKDPAQLAALCDLAAEKRDARALLAVGKTAVIRGFPLDHHAYPTMGIPSFEPVGDGVEKAMVYAIARQESAFNPEAQSHAGARGLMQLMPATAKRTAQRFGLGYDVGRLLSDPAYNAKLGSAHLGELLEDWRGSYVLSFASYNAGGGNVKKWIDRYGDPRSPEVDPVDWVERIPFHETRNYVQRVMENFQVYRHRLGERSALVIDSDLRRGTAVP